MNQEIKRKIKDYEVRFPTYYDLLKYVLKLEKEIEKRNENN